MVLSRVTKSKQPSCVWVDFGFDVCQLCEGPRPKSTPLESSHDLPELLSCLGGGVYSVGLDTGEHPRTERYSTEALGFFQSALVLDQLASSGFEYILLAVT